MSEQQSAAEGYDPDIPVCEAIGLVEGNHQGKTRVGDVLCEGKGMPENIEVSEWMEFLTAVHRWVDETKDQMGDDDE